MDLAARHRAVAVDFGTGDGTYARRLAAGDPGRLVIGVDANADNLREVSRRAAAKPARGGLPNAVFGRLSLEDAPGALEAMAGSLTVLLPWGSLLQAVVCGGAGLARLRGLCKPGANVEFVFGYGADSERATIASLALPAPQDLSAAELTGRYREAGFDVRVAMPSLNEVAALPTTWARKLAFSGKTRTFWRLHGRAG